MDFSWTEEQQAFYVYDPWESMNRRIYNFNAVFDEYVFLPVVRAYEFVLPNFAQTGVTNFFNNLGEINNLLNSLLQGKILKTYNTVGRILINTTVGIGGLIDVATDVEGIKRENEDFGQTLGFYGIGPGPYLILPVAGPYNLRDAGGWGVDLVAYNYQGDCIMPIYEYVCKDCREHFEVIMTSSSPETVTCKKCGSVNVSKTMSAASFRVGSSGKGSIPAGSL